MRRLLMAAFAAATLAVLADDEDSPRPLPQFPPPPESTVDASEDAIAAALRDLKSDDPSERAAAADRLFWIGEPARECLEGASGSRDPEVAVAARGVLGLLDARKELKPVDASEAESGYVHVGSGEVDREALGGFGPSDNMPVEIPKRLKAPGDRVSIVIERGSVAAWRPGALGFVAHIANTTARTAAFQACDSRLYIRIEAKDKDGAWKPVEGFPGTS